MFGGARRRGQQCPTAATYRRDDDALAVDARSGLALKPQPGLGEQLRSDLGDQGGDLALECLDRLGELADAPQFVAAMRTRIVCSALASRRATRGAQRP